MKRKTYIFISILLVFLLSGVVLVSCGSNDATPSGTLDGAALMQSRCSVCHSLTFIIMSHKTTDQWTATVDRMIAHGAQLNEEEAQTLIIFLAANYK